MKMKTWIKTICLIAVLALSPLVGAVEPTTYDVDGDGIENNHDNCPNVWNENQEDNDGDLWGDACDDDDDDDGLSDDCEINDSGTDPFDPDSDDDGITDLYDCAPNDPENSTYEDCFIIIEENGNGNNGNGNNGDGNGSNPSENPPPDTDGDGCNDDIEVGMHTKIDDPDTDGDGVPDCVDNCPIVSNPGQEKVEPTIDIGIKCYGDYDGDGICDEDEDIDGLCKAGPDNCIADPNPFQLDSDGDGIGNVCDPDSVDFGGPEPAIIVEGGGGIDGGCTLLASPATGTVNAWPYALILTTLLAFGIRRKKF